MDPSGGNLVHTFSLGSKAECFKSRDAAGAGLPTECLCNQSNRLIMSNKKLSSLVYKSSNLRGGKKFEYFSTVKLEEGKGEERYTSSVRRLSATVRSLYIFRIHSFSLEC